MQPKIESCPNCESSDVSPEAELFDRCHNCGAQVWFDFTADEPDEPQSRFDEFVAAEEARQHAIHVRGLIDGSRRLARAAEAKSKAAKSSKSKPLPGSQPELKTSSSSLAEMRKKFNPFRDLAAYFRGR